MSFIDNLVSHLGEIGVESDDLPLLVPAVIAAGALIAFADGTAEGRELREIDSEALHCLMGDQGRADDIRRVLDQHLSNFDRDRTFGHDRALGVLADFAPDAPMEQRELVLRSALQVGGACGALSPGERDAAREIARILRLDPAAQGL
ncbi:TerB family tellurite resistance protein [Skermanella mucosa]|uniref:TerB family tellurite resistance protein n=1 Tax=Skermanella mucosa TaxID=1789672 RepID=UPI00192ADD04|nr:TerB family tellurite resistance protein [Skermanella mucosa]UEM22195.1 TerB family tellurite resistance protein [Skermanella mucosa]